MFAVQIALGVADRRSVPRAELLRGSPLAGSIGVRDVPVSWDAYVDIIDRLRDRLGSDNALAVAAGDLPVVTPQVSAFAAHFVSAERLTRFFAQVLDPRIWPCVSVTYEDLGHRVVRVVHAIPDHYRGSRAFFAAGVGAWETTPCRLGLPPAEMVDVDLGPKRGAYTMRVPEAKTISARLKSRALEALARFAVNELEADAETIGRKFAIAAGVAKSTPNARAAARWRLTKRESEVLALILRGQSNKEIATELRSAVKTIEGHIASLLRKSATHSRVALVASCLR